MTNLAAGRYTWDDFLDLPDDDKRELIDGELVETEVTTKPHEYAVTMLCFFLTAWARVGHGGFALASSYKIRISDRRGVMPDVQFFRKGNPAAEGQEKGLTQGHPDLVVEVISPSNRGYDRVTKLRWYAELGVPEYWIVDPAARTVERLVLAPGGKGIYAIAASLREVEVFRPDSFDGLEIPLAELWT
jgi:Uma2 family endonuclease